MEASFNIDIYDYFNVDEIKDMIRYEVQDAIGKKVNDALRYVSVSDIITSTSRKIAMQMLEEQDIDLHQKMAEKTFECIDKLSLWEILRNNSDDTKSKGQLVLDECVEEARPNIQKKVDEIIEDKLDASWLIDEVVDAFYQKLCDQLIGK